MMPLNKKAALILGIALPFLLAAFTAAKMRLPNIGARPTYDFIYTTAASAYVVQGDQLIKSEKYTDNKPQPPLYLYDVSTNQSHEITFEAAQTLIMHRGTRSPDGYQIVPGTKDKGSVPFFRETESDYSRRYLEKNGQKIELNLSLKGKNLSNFDLIGWVFNK